MVIWSLGVRVDTDKCPKVDCSSCLKCKIAAAWSFHRMDLRNESIREERKIEINND